MLFRSGNDQQPDNYLDDSTSTAGQDFLHDFRMIIGARNPARPLQYGIVDKFGLEADEVDITASSVLGAFQAKGECWHNLSQKKTHMLSRSRRRIGRGRSVRYFIFKTCRLGLLSLS